MTCLIQTMFIVADQLGTEMTIFEQHKNEMEYFVDMPLSSIKKRCREYCADMPL